MERDLPTNSETGKREEETLRRMILNYNINPHISSLPACGPMGSSLRLVVPNYQPTVKREQ